MNVGLRSERFAEPNNTELPESSRDKEKSFLIITHYQRLLDYIKPDHVHVLSDGKIIKSGKHDLAKQLEKTGYKKIQ